MACEGEPQQVTCGHLLVPLCVRCCSTALRSLAQARRPAPAASAGGNDDALACPSNTGSIAAFTHSVRVRPRTYYFVAVSPWQWSSNQPSLRVRLALSGT